MVYFNRNSKKALKQDIEHLRKMLEVSEPFETYCTVASFHLKLLINDWIEELEEILKSNFNPD